MSEASPDAKLSPEDSGVQKHLEILQGRIDRMAHQSTQCKTWCVTLVSAILVLTIDQDEAAAALIGGVPVLALGSLDAYYLSLECDFRARYDAFVQSLAESAARPHHLFQIDTRSEASRTSLVAKACRSPSIGLFYGFLLLALAVIPMAAACAV